MSDADQAPPEEEEDDQAWLATFADLMSLLMCFFVLLLSFSEMDIQKYRLISGSLRQAFGVQREIQLPEPPKGISVIAREFSPGEPMLSPVKLMQSKNSDAAKESRSLEKVLIEQQRSYDLLRSALRAEIGRDLVEVRRIDGEIVIRIQESQSFGSGSARLRASIYPILDRIIESLEDTTGRLVVGGHTDNIPISTSTFASNWVLSSARAANVVHHLATSDRLGAKQIEIRAYADSRPIRDNDTAENRAVNRRVEIIVSPEDPFINEINATLNSLEPDTPGPLGDSAGLNSVEPDTPGPLGDSAGLNSVEPDTPGPLGDSAGLNSFEPDTQDN